VVLATLVAPLLRQDIEFGAVFVNSTPEQVQFPTQSHKHFIEMPRTTRLASCHLDPVSKVLTKLVGSRARTAPRVRCR
jgi:hypothetical protein